jgi:hypothetical protein
MGGFLFYLLFRARHGRAVDDDVGQPVKAATIKKRVGIIRATPETPARDSQAAARGQLHSTMRKSRQRYRAVAIPPRTIEWCVRYPSSGRSWPARRPIVPRTNMRPGSSDW